MSLAVRYRSIMMLLSLLMGGVSWPALAQDTADREAVYMMGNVSYMSGGVGEDSREHLKAFSAGFNLKLVLAMKSGEYVADVKVSIAGKDGKNLLQATAEGPIFMANLPSGSYEVMAVAGGVDGAESRSLRQRISVTKGKLSTLYFRW